MEALKNCFHSHVIHLDGLELSIDNKPPPSDEEKQQEGKRRQDIGVGQSDHQGSRRYISHFPIRMHIGRENEERVETVIAHDVSDGGIMLGNTDMPDSIKRLRVRFHSPRKPSKDVDEAADQQKTVRDRYEDQDHLRATFERPLPHRLAHGFLSSLWLAVELAMILALVLALAYESVNTPYFWFDPLLFTFALVVGVYLIGRFFFALFYRPPKPREDLPPVSIIIPAYNAQKHVAHTIGCALNSDYPDGRLQVIAVNDGSSDGTLATMLRMRNEYPQLEVIDLSENRGKRRAVTAAAHMATGEVIVVADAGSLPEESAIRSIVDGFTDPDVAGVCGHCFVANAPANLLTRIQSVRYFIIYRVLRASESLFGGVTLLSGPLAAYRKSHLLNVLEGWVRQRFLGSIATHGDDRALTNLLLRRHKIIYDRRACAGTLAPSHLSAFLKVQMRWRRSWFREGIHAASFIWRKRPLLSISFYIGVILTLIAPAIAVRAALNIPLQQTDIPLLFVAASLAGAAVVCALLLLAMRARFWLYGIPYVVFYALVLLVQMPWAILTCWKPRGRDT